MASTGTAYRRVLRCRHPILRTSRKHKDACVSINVVVNRATEEPAEKAKVEWSQRAYAGVGREGSSRMGKGGDIRRYIVSDGIWDPNRRGGAGLRCVLRLSDLCTSVVGYRC